MSLPNNENATDGYEQYFTAAISFLRENEWIFNFPNTDVLVHNIFDKFPKGWRYYLEKLSCKELNEIPFGFYKDDWSGSLKDFVLQSQNLKPRYTQYKAPDIDITLPNNFRRGLNPKKQHEIAFLAQFIHEKCELNKVRNIIDVGAGLGYISHLLHERYGYTVLGIESDPSRIESALKRQAKYHPKAVDHVKYFQHFVNDKSYKEIDNALTEWLGPNVENTCLIGLHACADLTITALEIFEKLSYIKLVVIMPCCYHKLEMEGISETEECFKKFPLSRPLRKVYDDTHGARFLKRPFLRIACQSSATVWRLMTEDEHREHSISHMRRAVLQLFVTSENYTLTKLKRKCMNRKTSSNCDFETYLKQLDDGFYLVPNKDDAGRIFKDYSADGERNEDLKFTSPSIKKKLCDLWDQYEKDCNMVEILSAFQNTIQSICENIILLDRVVFLQLKGFNALVEKVTDEGISPRCHALVASK